MNWLITCVLSLVTVTLPNFCITEFQSPDEAAATVDTENEYCQHETMKGRCRWKSEVIVMTSARWGRMRTGRCLNIHPNFLPVFGQDPMFLGCSEDVISIVDRKCSGRSECDIRIPDPELDTVTPCYPDQKSYLEASYTCVKVVQESRSCVVSVTADQQFIARSNSAVASDSSSMSSCGSRSHPWRLEAPIGQRINVSLLDFAPSRNKRSRDRDTDCQQYGYIIEKANKKNVSICPTAAAAAGGGKTQRENALYTSDTNTVDIIFAAAANAEQLNFLIKLNAVGCTNMIPPDNAWLKRSNNDIIIGCYLSQQTWQLKCDGREWKGLVGECTESFVADGDSSTEKKPQLLRTDDKSKMLMVMIVIAGGAVIICVVVITIGVTCLYRCKSTYRKTRLHTTADDVKYMNALNHNTPPVATS